MSSRLLIFAFILAGLLTACRDKSSQTVAVPKPTAYPRIADPGNHYQAIDSLPAYFLANASASITRPRPDWLDISYPGLGVTIHVSFTYTSPDDISRVIANRSDRMAINVSGGGAVTETPISTPDFTSVIICSPETRSTPLQFLAHDGKQLVVSGTAFFNDVAPDAPIDSLAPIITYVMRDLEHALNRLRPL